MHTPKPGRVPVKEEQLEAYGTSAKQASPPNLQWPRFRPGCNPAVPKGPSLGLFTAWVPHRNLIAANGADRALLACGTNTDGVVNALLPSAPSCHLRPSTTHPEHKEVSSTQRVVGPLLHTEK